MTTDAAWLEGTLATVQRARLAVFGDHALDAYWLVDSSDDEHSLETGLPVHRVVEQRWQAAGASNIARNAASLGVTEVHAIGLVGCDPAGNRLHAALRADGVRTDALLAAEPPWQTTVFAKPVRAGVEMSRYDFGTTDRAPREQLDALLATAARTTRSLDAVVINQQIPVSATLDAVDALNELIAQRPGTCFLVDCRRGGARFRGAAVKLNAAEAAARCGVAAPAADDPAAVETLAAHIHADCGNPVFVTQGDRGIVVADADGTARVAAVRVDGPIDPVGAGDTVAAALAAALAVGCAPRDAARLATLAAAVTVAKCGTTGTATPAEIRAVLAGAARGTR